MPQLISRISPESCLINEASRAELEESASFEKITLAAQQMDVNSP
jgi:hypothetical protein